MQSRLVSATCVINAHTFNPSIFTDRWVHDVLAVPDEDFQPTGLMITPMVATIPTRQFHILVVDERLQFSLRLTENGTNGALVREKVGAIVKALPHTPFKGLGINFDWRLEELAESNRAVSRKLFFSPTHWLSREFAADDACFGAYYSRDSSGFRLKLNILPTNETTVREDAVTRYVDHVTFSFNYHLDLLTQDPGAPSRVDRILAALGRWDEAHQEAERVVRLAEDQVSK